MDSTKGLRHISILRENISKQPTWQQYSLKAWIPDLKINCLRNIFLGIRRIWGVNYFTLRSLWPLEICEIVSLCFIDFDHFLSTTIFYNSVLTLPARLLSVDKDLLKEKLVRYVKRPRGTVYLLVVIFRKGWTQGMDEVSSTGKLMIFEDCSLSFNGRGWTIFIFWALDWD